jgi:hypothetical protein
MWKLWTIGIRAAIEMEMTAVVRENVQAQSGVEIPSAEPQPADAV